MNVTKSLNMGNYHYSNYTIVMNMVSNMIKEDDLKWLACAIDSEGTICGSGSRKNRIQIAVYNTNYDFVKKAANLMGTNIYPLTYYVNGEKRIVYSASTSKRMTILKILKQVEPYLVIKRMKAIASIRRILDYYDIADIQLRAYPSLP